MGARPVQPTSPASGDAACARPRAARAGRCRSKHTHRRVSWRPEAGLGASGARDSSLSGRREMKCLGSRPVRQPASRDAHMRLVAAWSAPPFQTHISPASAPLSFLIHIRFLATFPVGRLVGSLLNRLSFLPFLVNRSTSSVFFFGSGPYYPSAREQS